MQASLFLIVTLMPAPLPATKSQAQSIWSAHYMALVPQHMNPLEIEFGTVGRFGEHKVSFQAFEMIITQIYNNMIKQTHSV